MRLEPPHEGIEDASEITKRSNKSGNRRNWGKEITLVPGPVHLVGSSINSPADDSVIARMHMWDETEVCTIGHLVNDGEDDKETHHVAKIGRLWGCVSVPVATPSNPDSPAHLFRLQQLSKAQR